MYVCVYGIHLRGSVFLSIGLFAAADFFLFLLVLLQVFDNFCKIVFFVSFVFSTSLFIRVVEKFTPHIICDNCRLRSYGLFSVYQICSVFQPFFPSSVCCFCDVNFSVCSQNLWVSQFG